MRALLALPALLLALPVGAQMTGPVYTFADVIAPEEAATPGATVHLEYTVERRCSLGVDFLPAASAYIEFLAEEVLVVAGPGSVLFPEQVCALEPQVAVTFSASVAISEYAAPQAYKLTTLLHPAAGSPLRYSQSVSTDVLLEVALASSAPVMVAAEAKESPPAPVIALLAVLALAAVVVRRRNA